MSASSGADDIEFKTKPIDSTIHGQLKSMDASLSRNGCLSRKSVFLYGAIALLVLWPIAQTGGRGVDRFMLIRLVIGFWCLARFAHMHYHHQSAKAAREGLTSGNAALREQVQELVSHGSLSDAEKRRLIADLVGGRSRQNTIDFLTHSVASSKQAAQARLINAVALVAGVYSLCASLLSCS